MDEDEDEHGLQEAGAGLVRTRSHHKILRGRAQSSLALSLLNNGPDEVGHELNQLLWNMIILNVIRDSVSRWPKIWQLLATLPKTFWRRGGKDGEQLR